MFVSAVRIRLRLAVSCFTWTSLPDLRCTCTRGLQVLGATICEAPFKMTDDWQTMMKELQTLERKLQRWLAPVDPLSFEARCLFLLGKFAWFSNCLHLVSALEQEGHKPDSSDLEAALGIKWFANNLDKQGNDSSLRSGRMLEQLSKENTAKCREQTGTPVLSSLLE